MCHDRDLGGNGNIYPWIFYWDLPSICWGMSSLLRLWSTLGFNQSGYSGGWSLWTSLSGVWIDDRLFYLLFLPFFDPYLVGLPPASLSSWASPCGPATHLQHSCTWWPYKVYPTWFSGHSYIRRIEIYPFVACSWRLPRVSCCQLRQSKVLPCWSGLYKTSTSHPPIAYAH